MATDEVSSKFFVVLIPAKTTSGKITGLTMVNASVRRPTASVPANAIVIEVELGVPAELFQLKAKARLAADAAITIKSLQEIEKLLS